MAKSEELQKHTLRVLARMGLPGKPLSARAAGEKLDIGYNQIADMAKGKTPAEKTLMRFACAIHEDPADWLRYAGKHDFAKTLGIQGQVEENDAARAARQIASELSRVGLKQQSLVLRQVLAVIKAAQEPDDGELRAGGED